MTLGALVWLVRVCVYVQMIVIKNVVVENLIHFQVELLEMCVCVCVCPNINNSAIVKFIQQS